MKIIIRVTISSLFMVSVISCNTISIKPTNTLTPTTSPTSSPTITTTSTSTPKPTKTRITPTKTPNLSDLPTPSGKPAKEWKGIPIMKAAIAGEGGDKEYAFNIDTSRENIIKFYKNAMNQLGYGLSATGESDGETVMLIFMKGSDFVMISIIQQTSGLMYVLITK